MRSKEREDALTTLAIAALLNPSNQAVVNCAIRLKDLVDRSVVKSLLDPLIGSESPRLVVLNNTVDKVTRLHVGTATHNGIEYDILILCQGKRVYETSEVLSGVVTYLTKMGSPHGKVEVSFVHSYWRTLRSSVVSYSSGVNWISISDRDVEIAS